MPFSSINVAFIAAEYLVPNLNMWPTSVPLAIVTSEPHFGHFSPLSTFIPTGPPNPGSQFVAFVYSSFEAIIISPEACAALATFTSFTSLSPLTTTPTIFPSTLNINNLTVFFGDTFKNSETSYIPLLSGVATFSISNNSSTSAFSGVASAFSIFAA